MMKEIFENVTDPDYNPEPIDVKRLNIFRLTKPNGDVLDIGGIFLLNPGLDDYFVFSFDPKRLDWKNIKLAVKRGIKWFRRQEKEKNISYIVFPHVSFCKIDNSPRLYFYGFVSGGLLTNSSDYIYVSGFPKPILKSTAESLGISPKDMLAFVKSAYDWKYGYSQIVSSYPFSSDLREEFLRELIDKKFNDNYVNFGKLYWCSKNLVTEFTNENFSELLNDNSYHNRFLIFDVANKK